MCLGNDTSHEILGDNFPRNRAESCGLLEKVACQFLSIDKPLFDSLMAGVDTPAILRRDKKFEAERNQTGKTVLYIGRE